jgi:DNA repair protein RecO (recombination protein O)
VNIESAHGIILRTRPLTETSLIVHWLTPTCGRITTVAKGARRPRSPFAGKLDLFYAADFSFSRSCRSDLHNLREVRLHEAHGAIREDIVKLQQAAYAASFVEQTTETETPLPEIFELVRGFLKSLCGQKPSLQNIFALELKLLHELGLAPDLAAARLTPGAKKIIAALLKPDWKNRARLQLSRTQGGELREWLHGYLIFHLGRLPRGRAAALNLDN